MMSLQQVARLRKWHEDVVAAGEGRESKTLHLLGWTLEVPANVYPPHPLGLAELVLAEVTEEDRVLDVGTGSGINALAAATRSRAVVAVDVNPQAVEAAAENAARNGLGNRITVRASNIFENVDGRFDLIVFDPPFRWFPARTMLERGTTDENYAGLTTFFREVRDRLTSRGRVLLNFGTTGDVAYLHHLIELAGLTADEVRRVVGEKDGMTVAYFALKLTPDAAPTSPID